MTKKSLKGNQKTQNCLFFPFSYLSERPSLNQKMVSTTFLSISNRKIHQILEMCSVFLFVSYLGKSHCYVKTVKQMQKKTVWGNYYTLETYTKGKRCNWSYLKYNNDDFKLRISLQIHPQFQGFSLFSSFAMKLRQTKFCSAACGALSRIPPRFHRFSVKSYVFRIANSFKHLKNKLKNYLAEDIDHFHWF